MSDIKAATSRSDHAVPVELPALAVAALPLPGRIVAFVLKRMAILAKR